MNRRLFLRALVAGAAILAGCTRTDEPTDPVWGKEPCAHCSMLVSDRKHAGELVLSQERRYFDDVGCMVLWLEERGGKAERVWVRDPEGTRWVDATTSSFGDGASTPMDFGFEPRGSGISWVELRARIVAKKRSGA